MTSDAKAADEDAKAADEDAKADEHEHGHAKADEHEHEHAKADAKADAKSGLFPKEDLSWGVPAFARDFPEDAGLALLVAAFAAGDYATVREGAPALAASTQNKDVRRAAKLLRSRIEPDPTSRVFFGLTAGLLVFLMVWWATHDGPNKHLPPQPKPAPTVEFVK